MEVIPHYQDAFRECKQYPLLYCVDLPGAISQCCYELVELFGKIWGQCPRTKVFIETYKNEYLH